MNWRKPDWIFNELASGMDPYQRLLEFLRIPYNACRLCSAQIGLCTAQIGLCSAIFLPAASGEFFLR